MKTANLVNTVAGEMILEGKLTHEFLKKEMPVKVLDNYLSGIYSDFNIVLSENTLESQKEMLIGFILLFQKEFNLNETTVPNTYRLIFETLNGKTFAMDGINRTEEFLQDQTALFLNLYFDAFQENSLVEFKKLLHDKKNEWNATVYVAQERLYKLSRTKLLPEMADETGYPEEMILKILDDYRQRMDVNKLEGLKNFDQKMTEIIKTLPEEKAHFKNMIDNLLSEIHNSGLNVNRPEDLFPGHILIDNRISLS